ncbi:YkoF family thiamine/hydroxymethylpyrimidine-binding protein [Alteromonas sp. ASW11-36]|uniref:YkoF family thiamine/hydroxymethylpyrimidine-binding protein n=1 Tax=Alteromonas arenosi TaxID=3055817 RepID=A0ABT7SV71_9ALTE|nr:YkoF family thiamine/hydroxymethylpyrimidine-binding protein [Alteromonas sp. ASW11-36]MDM7860055.1 YkoF family thiamine/hydroxymethylpyrimidine-binding protein [Alteromonas sp. ASW11-36]
MRLCTAEISLYPLADEYLPVIKGFIDRLSAVKEFEMSVTTTSTQVRGPYQQLFTLLGSEIERIHATTGQAILVCKFLAGDDIQPGLHSDNG